MLQRTIALAILTLTSAVISEASNLMDLAPSGQLSTWQDSETRRLAGLRDATGSSNLGVEWDEERDVREIRVHYTGEAVRGVAVEYWFKNWPYDPPKMPSFEDPMDDPWQGNWLKASSREDCSGSDCVYRFSALTDVENPRAARLPGVDYRRTLKVRLVFPRPASGLDSMQVFSGTKQKPYSLEVQWDSDKDQHASWSGRVSVYNGILRSVSTDGTDGSVGPPKWNIDGASRSKALNITLVGAQPDLPGSHDLTVVTVHAVRYDAGGKQNRGFSFLLDDLKHGPISLPGFGVRVVDLDPGAPKGPPGKPKLRVRDRIPLEPEQTLERASREIPPLDPWDREWGGRVYLPLAPDSDWQKFAFEYGGNVFVSKNGIKAKGDELARLQWDGDKITWKVGTGQTPYYREDHAVSVSKLEGYLPVVTQRWENAKVEYSEEAFSTVLNGPLSPKGRDEETPALLMVRMTAKNTASDGTSIHFWVSVESAGELTLDGTIIRANGKVAGILIAPQEAQFAVETIPQSAPKAQGVHVTLPVSAGGTGSFVLQLPCVSDLTAADAGAARQLDYTREREKVIAYWKGIVEPAIRFKVPEPRFELLQKTVVSQIHISTTKDPKTGLYMVPAASYVYDVFENESCYQILLLDTLGQFDTAAEYLETLMRLQGSKNFPGMQKGSTEGIFHGARINETYDYTMSGYGLDHGTVLWTLAQHYLYSRDRAWLEHAWPHMQKAIAWIEEQRASTKVNDVHGNKVREYGMLPASQLEDNVDWANWFSSNAFAWAGMQRTAEALADIGYPAAAEVQRQADQYRADLREAVLGAVEAAPAARMQDGSYEPYVPVLPTRRFRLFGPIRADYYHRYPNSNIKPLMRLGADRDTLCGAVVLVILGVFSPQEPIANWILDDWEDNETLSSGMGLNIHGITDDRYWFSQGGMVFQANLMNPIQVYLWRHEAPSAIRNLYNDFVSCLYPQTNMFTEEFHQWRHGSGPFYKISDESRFVNRVRDTLVIEQNNTLWLAPGTPRRWLTDKQGIEVKGIQTFFGPVSYQMHPGSRPGLVEAIVNLPPGKRATKAWLAVRVPRGKIQSVTLDGKPWTNLDPKLEAIELPQREGPMTLEIAYK
ncbi:MAG: hypothetical protein JWP08_2830 [Bryobacterales bacterium]|nr:hypothetical protein [Bryobacterales bacterium]